MKIGIQAMIVHIVAIAAVVAVTIMSVIHIKAMAIGFSRRLV